MKREILISEWLKSEVGLAACEEAREWLASLHAGATMGYAWERCRIPQWLLWFCWKERICDDLVLRKISCALVRRTPLLDGRTVWDLLTNERSRREIEVAEDYCEGKANEKTLAAAWAAVWAVAEAADWAVAEAAARTAQCDIIRALTSEAVEEK